MLAFVEIYHMSCQLEKINFHLDGVH